MIPLNVVSAAASWPACIWAMPRCMAVAMALFLWSVQRDQISDSIAAACSGLVTHFKGSKKCPKRGVCLIG